MFTKLWKLRHKESCSIKIITNSTILPFTVASKITRRGGKERSKMKSEHKDCYRMTLKTSYYHRTTLRRFDKNQAWDVIQIHCKLHAEKKFSSCSSTRSLTYGWSLDSVVLRDVDMKVKIVWVCLRLKGRKKNWIFRISWFLCSPSHCSFYPENKKISIWFPVVFFV